ncbi:MAG: VWA domain-containing protein [Planctomycetes bacterium]|nr:VWA domain-containing protein [Planctomycetota bacterium]
MKKSPLILAMAVLFVLAGPVLADGFIIVPRHPPERPEVRTIPLAVKYHRVTVTIRDQVAVTEIDQVFINPNPYELEGTYIFPLPETASISRFSMYIDDKEMPGELLEKDKARKIYEDIVRSMKDPALLEYFGRDMFKASIFPIPARGEKRVRLSYQEICSADAGLVRYRYPLNTEKFSSRPLEDVSVVIDIAGKSPIKNITCPTHPVEVVKKSETEARVAYEAKNVTPDKDLLLYYSISEAEFALNFLTHRANGAEDGYFMLLLSPGVETGKPIDKDVCFVFDTSGSMQGKKIQQAKAALKFCLGALNPGDRFNLITFATEARAFGETLLAADKDNVARALEFVEKIQALGGTATDEALQMALKLSPNADRPYMVVFFTDGLPTIGETREPVIVDNVKKLNKGNVRLFAFGLGNDVNTHLLDKLAEENRGTRDYVAESEDLELKVSSFYTKISHPVLSDLELAFPGVRVTDVYPKRLSDLFKGSQLVVVGRYAEFGAKALKLSGKVGAETKLIAHDIVLAEKEEQNTFLPRLWAIRKIGYLLDEIRLRGESDELKAEVVRLAKLHGVVTPYTSFLVLEDERQLGREVVSRETFRAGVVPRGGYGGDSGGAGRSSPPAPSAPPSDEEVEAGAAEARSGLGRATGGGAVGASKDAAKLKGESGDDDGRHSLVPDAGAEGLRGLMQLVEGTAFYLTDGVWSMANLPEKAERKAVEQFSDLYFELLGKSPKVGLYLALGKVDFLLDGIVYQIR